MFCSSGALDAAALGGFCHTFILIETDSETYILERLLEGIRFSAVADAAEEVKNAVCMVYSSSEISSYAIADWIDLEAKKPYSLTRNNCIHFAYDFIDRFTNNREFGEGLMKFAVNAYSCIPGGKMLVEKVAKMYSAVANLGSQTESVNNVGGDLAAQMQNLHV